MSNRTAGVCVALVVIALAAACAAGRAPSVPVPPLPTDVAPPPSPNPCLVVPHPENPRDTAIIVVEVRDRPWSMVYGVAGAPVENPAAAASSRAADFVIAQVYQPLVRITCDGRVVPEVAQSVRIDSSTQSIRIDLRADIRFADGATVTVADAMASLSARMPGTFLVANSTFPPSFSVRPLTSERPTQFAFGHLARAIWRAGSPGEWPIGSGPFAVATVSAGANAGTTVLRPTASRAGPVLVVREDSTSDKRDLLDRGVDMLETRDPVVLDYARGGAFTIKPLPFDRTYILAIPANARQDSASAAGSNIGESDVAAFRTALASDAVRVEARAAAAPLWSRNLACADSANLSTGARGSANQSPPSRIMYDAKDPVARLLAERLVAIARTGAGSSPGRDARLLAQIIPGLRETGARTLTAVAADENALRTGSAVAFVIAVPARVLAPCGALLRAQNQTPWLTPAAMFALVDTRSYLVARTGAPAAVVDWDGTLRILPSLPVRRVPQP